MAQRKPEDKMMMTQEILTIKRELDRAVQERMKLSQIYCRNNNNNNSVPVPAASS
jgi:hypothetical protein